MSYAYGSTNTAEGLFFSSECEACSGSGYVYDDDGRAVECECKRRWDAQRRLARIKQPAKFGEYLLADFQPRSAEQRTMVDTLAAYAADPPKTGILLIGPVGTGKTHMLATLMRELVSTRKVNGRFWRADELLDAGKRAFDRRRDDEEPDPLLAAREVKLLLLDDLGVERLTDWQRSEISLLISHRSDHELRTFITSNMPLAELSKPDFYGARIGSRLGEMCKVLVLRGADQRKGGGA